MIHKGAIALALVTALAVTLVILSGSWNPRSIGAINETDTATQMGGPILFKVDVVKANADDLNEQMVGWEFKVFAGDGCTGSPIRTGLTVDGTLGLPALDFAVFSVELPAGDHSAAETQQSGWERVFPQASPCQSFTIITGQSDRTSTFVNRVIRNGDGNGDGATNSVDASVALQFTAGLATEDDIIDFFRLDVNLDETTDSRDATLILQMTAGFIDSLPVGGS